MPELIAKTALDGRRLTLGGVTLAEVDLGPVASVAVFPGCGAIVDAALQPFGLAMPAPNRMQVADLSRIVWTGRDQAFVIGVAVQALQGAAVTDQSGGWACIAVSGPAAGDVLARLIPLDLRLASFGVGTAVRAPLNHMNAVVMRVDTAAFEIMVFRSMARTAWHEIVAAAQGVAAR